MGNVLIDEIVVESSWVNLPFDFSTSEQILNSLANKSRSPALRNRGVFDRVYLDQGQAFLDAIPKYQAKHSIEILNISVPYFSYRCTITGVGSF